MVYRITGGITFILMGLDQFGYAGHFTGMIGIFAFIAGIALLAGV